MIKQFLKTKFELLAVIALNVLAYSSWFLTTKVITYGDFRPLLLPTQKDLLINSFFIYSDRLKFGNTPLDASNRLIDFFYGLLGNLGFNYGISQRILLLWPFVILTPIIGYALALKILRSRPAAVISALVLMFNTYTLVLINGGTEIAFADTLMAVFFYYAYKYLVEKSSRINLIKLVAIGVVFAAYEFRIFYIGAGIISLFVIFSAIFQKMRTNIRSVLSWATALGLILLLNLSWILPFYFTGNLTSNEVFNRALFGTNFFDLPSALTLFHRFWTGGVITVFVNQPIPLYFWLVPIFAFIGLALNYKNKTVLFFGIVALMGVFLTKMEAKPFSDVYAWLYIHFPGFNAFREASKFYAVIAIGYSILLGAFVAWLWRPSARGRWKIVPKYLLTALTAFLFLWNAAPIYNKKIGALLLDTTIPHEYEVFNDFILKQPEFFRTYWVPGDSRWAVFTNNHPKIIGADIISAEWQPFAPTTHGPEPFEKLIMDPFNHTFTSGLLNQASVKYVVVPLRDTANNDDIFVSLGDRDYFIHGLDQVSYLKRIDIGTREITIYENTNFGKYIYASSDLFHLNSAENFDIKYNLIKELNKDFNFILEDWNKNRQNAQSTIEDKNFLADYANQPNIISDDDIESKTKAGQISCYSREFDESAKNYIRENTKEKKKGNSSIEAESNGDTPCVSLSIDKIKPDSYYHLTFDIENDHEGEYDIIFNDPAKTKVVERIYVGVLSWVKISKIVKTPIGANSLELRIYSNTTKDKSGRGLARYDNFSMVPLPDFETKSYPIQNPQIELQKPEKIDFEIINATKKLVHIKGAIKPFFLNMGSAFDDAWQLNFKNNKTNSWIDASFPFMKPDRVSDQDHFRVNHIYNGWYIDVNDYCGKAQLCTRNSDGSYDMDMVIEFWPQRLYNLGLLVAGLTFIGLVTYLTVGSLKGRKK